MLGKIFSPFSFKFSVLYDLGEASASNQEMACFDFIC